MKQRQSAPTAARAPEDARADENSERLLLHGHELHQFDLPVIKFIRAHRKYPLAVLKAAEFELRAQLHRCTATTAVPSRATST